MSELIQPGDRPQAIPPRRREREFEVRVSVDGTSRYVSEDLPLDGILEVIREEVAAHRDGFRLSFDVREV